MRTIKLVFYGLLFSNLSFAQCFTTVKTSTLSTIGLQTDGSIWGWGYNGSSVLGLGLDNTSFHTIFPSTQIGTAADWSSRYSMAEHVLALKNNGTLWTWGKNNDGECGNGSSGNQNYVLAPTQIGTATWQDVATGLYYSLGVRTDGTLWAWGDNLDGQLGDGTTNDSTIPLQIGTDNHWSKVFAYGRTSYGIKTDGTLWSWGKTNFTLGRTNGNYNIPGQVGTDTDWLLVAPSVDCTMAIKSNGTLWVWGRNTDLGYTAYYGNGQTDTHNYQDNPTQVGTDTNWKKVSTDQYNFRALKTNGTLWGWGNNYASMLGDGTNSPKYTPVQLGTDTDWSDLVGYSTSIYALKSNHSLFGWGFIVPNTYTTPTLHGTVCTELSTTSLSVKNLVKAYPNPTHNTLNLLFDEAVSVKKIILYDALGKVIINRDTSLNTNEMQIDLTFLASGLYILQVTGDSVYDTIKISKN